MKPKVLLVSSYDAPYVRNDENILRDNFNVETAIFTNPKKSLNYILFTVRKLFKSIRRNDISVIWFADFRAFLTVVISKILQKKTIIIVGGYETANEPEMKYGSVYKKRTFFIHAALRHCTKILAISDFSKKEIITLVPNRKPIKICLCTDSESIESETKENTVVLIGNAVENFYPTYKLKGIDTFVKAASLLPDYKFTVIGRYSEEVLKKLKLHDNIEFTGFLPNEEVQQILSETKVYCQLSYRESFGLALAEAMNQGCIPVVTKRGALPELVGDTGFYVPYANPEETAEAIKTAMKSDYGIQARSRIAENFFRKKREQLLVKEILDL
jgi:glycosyltransferase involved in cell wall biosynthesis